MEIIILIVFNLTVSAILVTLHALEVKKSYKKGFSEGVEFALNEVDKMIEKRKN